MSGRKGDIKKKITEWAVLKLDKLFVRLKTEKDGEMWLSCNHWFPQRLNFWNVKRIYNIILPLCIYAHIDGVTRV